MKNILIIIAILFLAACTTTTPKTYLNSSMLMAKEKNYDAAIAELDKGTRRYAKNSELFAMRAKLKYEKGDVNGAVEDFNMAIKNDPNSAEAFYFRGFVYAKNQDYKKAIEDLKAAIKINPQETKYYSSIEEYYVAAQDYKGADEFLSNLKKSYSGTIVNITLANIKKANMEFDSAIKEFKEVKTKDPKASEGVDIWIEQLEYYKKNPAEAANCMEISKRIDQAAGSMKCKNGLSKDCLKAVGYKDPENMASAYYYTLEIQRCLGRNDATKKLEEHFYEVEKKQVEKVLGGKLCPGMPLGFEGLPKSDSCDKMTNGNYYPLNLQPFRIDYEIEGEYYRLKREYSNEIIYIPLNKRIKDDGYETSSGRSQLFVESNGDKRTRAYFRYNLEEMPVYVSGQYYYKKYPKYTLMRTPNKKLYFLRNIEKLPEGRF